MNFVPIPEFSERLRFVADLIGPRKQAAEIAGVSLDAIIRYLRGENQPSFKSVSRLCEAAEISMQWLATGEEPRQLSDLKTLNLTRSIPISGMAESTDSGWYNAQNSSMQMTLDIPDPQAFATMMNDQSLVPEGIQPGFICICSPMLQHVPGDIVHLKRADGLCALRVFIGEEKDWFVLKAFTDKDDKGSQRSFEDRIKRSTIQEIAPVVFIKRKI